MNLVDPEGLEPYYELSLNRKYQSTFDSFRNMWLRLHQKSSIGRYIGVKVDPTWVSFKKFIEDMGERPVGNTLDRIDGSKGYCKENCRWADIYQQAANRKGTVFVSDGEEVLPFKVMCKKYNLPYGTIHHRFRCGWDIDEAFSTPVVWGNNYTHQRQSPGKFSIHRNEYD